MKRFLSCDWGTSTLRVRVVETEPLRIVEEFRSDLGALRLQTAVLEAEEGGESSPEVREEARARRFEETLYAALSDLEQRAGVSLADCPVMISGMATSTIGWRELPYGKLPLDLDGGQLPIESLSPRGPGGASVYLVSGVCAAADVMRGEEAEILGLLRAPECAEYRAASWLILPGTHSKHVQVAEGHIVDFQTFMTGELFEVLSRSSILRNSVDPEALEEDWWTNAPTLAAFREGVALARQRPLSACLFSVRAHQVLQQQPADWGAGYLSGLLIGYEMSAASQLSESAPMLLCARGALLAVYRLAGEVLGIDSRLVVPSDEAMEMAVARAHEVFLRRVAAGS